MKRKLIYVLIVIVVLVLITIILNVLTIIYRGSVVPAPNIPRDPQTLGSGPKLTYVVMGDSTSIGQGTDYSHSYALNSAEHLAKTHEVTFVNVGVSGARVLDVLDEQLSKAETYKPDIVLIGVGANDTTHFTSGASIQTHLQKIVDGLKAANPNVKIVVTRSPALDSVSRFPFPSKQLLGIRTTQVNKAFGVIIHKNSLTLAPIAENTREAFLKDPTLTASDDFHPNARGYALWIPIVNDALDRALR